jgi:hypothetical protein
MVILTTFLAPPLLRFVFQEPQSDTTPSEMATLDGSSTQALAMEQTIHNEAEPEEVETAPEQKKS